MKIDDFAKATIENVLDFIQGKPYKSLSEIVSGENDITSAVMLLRAEAEGLETSKDPIEYQFAFALKRDTVSRYASRKLLYKAGLDKKLYNANLMQATSLINKKMNGTN